MTTLLVVNVSMSEKSMLFSHQQKAVHELSKHFLSTVVLTREISNKYKNTNIKIVKVPWKRKRPVRNSISLMRKAMPILSNSTNLVVFTHMSDSMAAVLSPITRFFGINHYLWYAHKKKSLYLRFAYLFLNGIITSTPGSCPFHGQKIFSVGQGIDISAFKGSFNNSSEIGRTNFFNYGRLDKSKRIDLLIEVIERLRESLPNLTLTFFGETASKDRTWLQKMESLKQLSIDRSYLNFYPPIEHENIVDKFGSFDIFIHAFAGSLDKTLLEATLLKKPVVTCNPEYLSIFGSWSKNEPCNLDDLHFLTSEIEAILRLPDDTLDIELVRRFREVISNHSLEGWAERISRQLLSKVN